ncbi:MAG: hypothetical protein WA783_09650 [Phormidesmis sp.]
MMQQFNSWFVNVNAYADMSPDIAIRHQVNQWLKDRARYNLELSAWQRLFAPQSKNSDLLTFIYQRFGRYSGLSFGRVRPRDTFHGDLHFALVCWHDWVITFCEDFYEQFHIDLSDRFDEDDFETIGEMIAYLDRQIALEQEKSNRSTSVCLQVLPSTTAIAS